jgi:hypothetical protein
MTHHVDRDLANRSHAEYHHSEADDGDSRPCAANQCEQQEEDKFLLLVDHNRVTAYGVRANPLDNPASLFSSPQQIDARPTTFRSRIR